jgi:hypothetical protein
MLSWLSKPFLFVEKLWWPSDSVYSLPDLQRITPKHDTHTKVIRVYFGTVWACLLTLYWLISIWNLFVPFSILCPSAEVLTFDLDQPAMMRSTTIQNRRRCDMSMSLALAFHQITILHFLGWSAWFCFSSSIRTPLHHQDGKHFNIWDWYI